LIGRLIGPGEPAGGGFTVTREHSGETLAAVVRSLGAEISWSRARDLCRSGRVWLDGVRETDPARRLAGGERIELRLEGPALRRGAVPPEAIVHLDADVAVVRKPAGLLTVPFDREGKRDRDTLLSLARVAVRRLEAARGPSSASPNPSLRAVQRLDKDTSGLVVFARNARAQRLLQEQLGEHSVIRRYLAIVHGAAVDAVYDTLFVADRGDGLKGSWGVFRPTRAAPPEGAKTAVTRVRAVERLAGATLVECELETGRQHQIRIHLAEAGHPVVGETVYVRDWRGPLVEAPRLMLHAAALGFTHPRTGREVCFEDPPPADFTAVLERLRRPREGP
jgi:23S rRNA pseudouridine1911/1915/1917 synthase